MKNKQNKQTKQTNKEKKIEKILESYPDILTKKYNNIIDKIDDIEGFDKITATKFAEHIDDFNEFLEKIPENIKNRLTETKQPTEPDKLSGITFLFTGFRNKNWKKIIEDNGGKVNDSFSKNINYVITTDLDEGGNKLDKAKKYNIPILLKEQLITLLSQKYNIYID